MIVLRTPKGWTGPEGGRRPAGRGHVPRPPGAARRARRQPRAPRAARGVDALLPPRGAVRRATGALRRRARGLAPEGERRMGANPHANGGLLLRDLRPARLPRLRRRRRRARRRRPSEATRVLGGFLRDVMRANADRELPHLRPRRDRLQPARRRLRGHRPRLDGRAPRRRRPPRARRPGDGGPQRAPLPGLARGLPAHRPPRPLHLLRGVHPHRRLDVQPARQVAEGHARHPVAAADRLAELPARLARLAPGPQRLLPPGPGLHRPRGQQEGRDHPRLPAAGRQHAALGGRPLPAQPRLRQRHRGRQAAGARLPDDGRGGRALHARASASGTGRATTTAASPTSCWPAPATSRRSRRWPRPRCCASTCPS